jgi:hypothetical protein
MSGWERLGRTPKQVATANSNRLRTFVLMAKNQKLAGDDDDAIVPSEFASEKKRGMTSDSALTLHTR